MNMWRLSPGAITRKILALLDRVADVTAPDSDEPEHLRMGRKGEEDAYFHLRRLGYVMVARNFRTPLRKGEIDLIGWQDGELCFIEVKTRTSRKVKPAEAAVDYHKQRTLLGVARDYMRLAGTPRDQQKRFDILSVYYDDGNPQPAFELFRNAIPLA